MKMKKPGVAKCRAASMNAVVCSPRTDPFADQTENASIANSTFPKRDLPHMFDFLFVFYVRKAMAEGFGIACSGDPQKQLSGLVYPDIESKL